MAIYPKHSWEVARFLHMLFNQFVSFSFVNFAVIVFIFNFGYDKLMILPYAIIAPHFVLNDQ